VEDKYEDFRHSIERIMKATGRNRRQATSMLVQALKSGKVRARGTLPGKDHPEPIPPEVFQKILPSEH
jgi:hypothetical protein